MATLGGSTMVWNAIEQDYNIIECLNCLLELCDELSVAVGGDDGTRRLVGDWVDDMPLFYPTKKIHCYWITQEEWDSQQGREKLSYFSNKAIELLTTDFLYYQQADEVTHESSFPFIRQAIEEGQEGFIVTRFNLWASPFSMLDVDQNRKPCSTEVIRLTKTKYRCISDAESVGIPDWPNVVSFKYLHDIKIYHMGFVRDKYKHLTKIKHIQEKVFLWDVDKRIHDNTDGFQPWKWGFTPKDVVPIKEKLPKFIEEWAKDRCYDPFDMTSEGYLMAKSFLMNCGEWLRVSSGGFSVDGYIITHEANSIWWRLMKESQK